MKAFCIFVAACFIFIVSSQETNEESCDDYPDTTTEPAPSPEPVPCPSNLEQLLTEANAKFTGQFLYNSMQAQPGENLIMSAFSVLTPIGQLAYFSQGNTEKQFLSALNLSSKEHIKCVFPPLLKRLSDQQNVILNLAVRIFATDSYPLTQKFVNYTRDVFNGEPESLDFSNGQASADKVNEWAANATNDRIKEVVNPSTFTAETRLLLANAIYFLGNWVHQFDSDSTDNRDFTTSKNEKVQIPTMYQQNTFKYGESAKLDAKVLEVPYKGNNFSFVIVLPNKVDGLDNVVEKLQNSDAFYEAIENTKYEKVELYLPKLKYKSEHNLANIMSKAGMTDVFNPGTSNLADILQVEEPLHISSGIQKAFVLVDEKGTEAAAVNVFVVGVTSVIRPPPKIYEFKCDHPFAFYILYDRIPIFSGVFQKPNDDK